MNYLLSSGLGLLYRTRLHFELFIRMLFSFPILFCLISFPQCIISPLLHYLHSYLSIPSNFCIQEIIIYISFLFRSFNHLFSTCSSFKSCVSIHLFSAVIFFVLLFTVFVYLYFVLLCHFYHRLVFITIMNI